MLVFGGTGVDYCRHKHFPSYTLSIGVPVREQEAEVAGRGGAKLCTAQRDDASSIRQRVQPGS